MTASGPQIVYIILCTLFRLEGFLFFFYLIRLSGIKPWPIVPMRRMPANIFIYYTWRIICTACKITAHIAFFSWPSLVITREKNRAHSSEYLPHTKSSEKTNLIWKKRKCSFIKLHSNVYHRRDRVCHII